MYSEIFLDADGVLVNWRDYVGKRLHLVSNRFSDFSPKDNIDRLNKMSEEERDVVLKDYYKRFPNTFARLEVMSDFYVLVKKINKYREEGIKVCILTSLGGDYYEDKYIQKEHKRNNLIEHLLGAGIEDIPIIVVDNNSDKLNYVTSNSILIDDYVKNCKEWVKEGGLAITHITAYRSLGKLHTLLLKNKLVA